jgi:uncharacterized membrane protein YccC
VVPQDRQQDVGGKGTSAVSTATYSTKRQIAGFPLSAWSFGVRNWAAMMLALYLAFWLQLENALSAAVCVGILSLPTRGQAAEKAFWRLLGTVIGIAAGFVIAGVFNQLREPFIIAYAAWLGLCVFVARFFDGNRAYGAMLSGYTVSLVAITQIDAPQNVFSTGVNRGAALAVGVIAVAFVNDLLGAPEVFPQLRDKIIRTQRRVGGFVSDALRLGPPPDAAVGDLLKDVVALRADVNAMPTEGPMGGGRASLARVAIAAMVQQIGVARATSAVISRGGNAGRRIGESWSTTLSHPESPQARELRASLRSELGTERADPERLVAVSGAMLLLDRDRVARNAIRDLEQGQSRRFGMRLPTYSSYEVALRDALRAFAGVTLVGLMLSLSNWPQVSFVLALMSGVLAVSSGLPDPRGFAKAACIFVPIVALLAGVIKFLILDGTDQFPLLAMALAPVVITASLLVVSNKQALYMFGFLTLVFVPALLAPSNPQDYSPLAFLTTAMLAWLAMLLLFLAHTLLWPTSDAMRRRWIMRSARIDFQRAMAGRDHARAGLTSSFRAADRIATYAGLNIEEIRDRREADTHALLWLAEASTAARRAHEAIARVHSADARQAQRAISTLHAMDASALRAEAGRLLGGTDAAALHSDRLRAAVAMIWMAGLIEQNRALVVALKMRRKP